MLKIDISISTNRHIFRRKLDRKREFTAKEPLGGNRKFARVQIHRSDIPEDNKKPTMQQVFPETPFDPARPVPARPALQPPRTAQPYTQLPHATLRKSR
jgi:hypothetical protein